MARIIKIDNPKLKKLIIDKADLVTAVRSKSEEVEKLENQMHEVDLKIQAYEKTVDISDLKDRGDKIAKRMDTCLMELKAVEADIYARMKKDAPQELYTEYESLKKQKEDMETERNKIALKVQKHKDKIIPMAQKIMKPLLENEFEDYAGIDVIEGELEATIFNHLDDFKEKFLKTKKQ